MTQRLFALLAVAVVLLALAIRLHYVLTVTVVNPLGGDAFEYVRYADNMLRGYFGHGDGPDAYRSPGYPVLVLLAKLAGASWPAWLKVAQAVLGALTVGGTILIGRAWLPAWGALVAGVLLALWPHHIAMTAEVLSETLFGFLLVLALWLAVRRKAVGSGFVFAAASLTNPVAFLLPVALAFVLRERRLVVGLLLPALLVPMAWSLRPVDGGSDRLWTNLVQGSWPLYHRAWQSRDAHPEPAKIIADINREVAITIADQGEGVAAMWARMSQQPLAYVKWYATKPFLLWDWDMRIATGGPYVHEVKGSTLGALSAVGKAINPLLFWLALAGALWGLWLGPASLRMVALAFLYFTALHTVLQAEPRYSTSYRAMEMLLAAAFASCAIKYLSVRLSMQST